jgi:acetoacetyl-CoA synthetase
MSPAPALESEDSNVALFMAWRRLAQAPDERPALVSVTEGGEPAEMSWDRLRREVAAVSEALRGMGVGPGDCVAGCLTNLSQAVVPLLATTAVGAVWTVCSPDFGTTSVLARLRQFRPKVLVAADGYRYGGKHHDRRSTVSELLDGLPTVRHLLAVDNILPPQAGARSARSGITEHDWTALLATDRASVCVDVPLGIPKTGEIRPRGIGWVRRIGKGGRWLRVLTPRRECDPYTPDDD